MCPSGMRGRCVMRICDAVYLVDTNVISAGAPSKGQRWAELAEWMDANSDRLFLSTVSVAEIEAGIAKADPPRLAARTPPASEAGIG